MSTDQQQISDTRMKGDTYPPPGRDIYTFTERVEVHDGYEMHVVRKKQATDDEEHYTYIPQLPNRPPNSQMYSWGVIEKCYADVAAEWKESDTLGRYKNFFNDESGVRDNIDRIIVLALGSFSTIKDEWCDCSVLDSKGNSVLQNLSLYQLAFVESLGECLPNVTSNKIYFQDPGFTKVDIDFIHSRNRDYQVVDCPYVYNQMSKTTLLINLCYLPAVMHAFEIDYPAMYIGTELPFTSALFKKFCDNHREFFPHDLAENLFTENFFAFGEKKAEVTMPEDELIIGDSRVPCQLWPRLGGFVYYLKSADLDVAVDPTRAD